MEVLREAAVKRAGGIELPGDQAELSESLFQMIDKVPYLPQPQP